MQPVLAARLRHAALHPARHRLVAAGTYARADVVGAQARIPDVEVAHGREVPHRLPVGVGGGRRSRTPLAAAQSRLATRDRQARSEPLDIPLPRPRQCLVEVVEVEDELAVGSREDPEVGEVRVAAELSEEAGPRGGGQVGRHDRRRSAKERERRLRHASVPDRKQLRNPRLGLALEDPDRVGPVSRWAPVGMSLSGDRFARSFAEFLTLAHRW